MCLKLFLVILRHFSNVSNVPLGGRVESQIVPLRDALTSELHSCVSAFDFFWCLCTSMCVWVIIILGDTDGCQSIVFVHACAFYLCHTLFAYAEDTVCSPQNVCLCVFWVSASLCPTFLPPSLLSLWFTHINYSHTHTHSVWQGHGRSRVLWMAVLYSVGVAVQDWPSSGCRYQNMISQQTV